VDIGATPRLSRPGTPIRLFGLVNIASPGVPIVNIRDRIVIVAHPVGRPAFRIGSVWSGKGSRWQVTVHPLVTTAYRAVTPEHPQSERYARSHWIVVRVHR
jgi:hypothetical protein